MATPFTTTRRVEFGDTDMAGIVHFANFFRFMESAETEFLRSLGFSVHWKGDTQRWGLPRVAASCDYKKPARFEDVLSISVTVERLGAKSISYRHDFTNQHGDLLAVGHITAVFCKTSATEGIESTEIPADIREKLQRHVA